MSFTKEKRAAIKKYMLEKIDEAAADPIKRTVDAFGIVPATAYRYMRELIADGLVERNDGNYSLVSDVHLFIVPLNTPDPPSEDLVYAHEIAGRINDLPENVKKIWAYCFTEMMNNAIEHSEGSAATVIMIKDPVNTTILIVDDGVGIFRKIQSFYNFPDATDAVIELFKGKLTTDKEHHSGEGIFFTSRLLDAFAAISGNVLFSHSEYSEVIQDLKNLPMAEKSSFADNGTCILMKLSNESAKNIKEIMDTYADVDNGLTRTRIPLKNIYPHYPVSRSQARRLLLRFEDFKEVMLDFDGIQEIGQAFAHEIFFVFRNKHPDVSIVPVNASADVQKMIDHVTSK